MDLNLPDVCWSEAVLEFRKDVYELGIVRMCIGGRLIVVRYSTYGDAGHTVWSRGEYVW